MEVPLDQRLLTTSSILVNFLYGVCFLGEGGGKKFMHNTHQKEKRKKKKEKRKMKKQLKHNACNATCH